jgi:hypothetical protein
MALFLQDATDLLHSLYEHMPPPQVQDVIEEFTNHVGDGGDIEIYAKEFLDIMDRVIQNRIRGQAENRKRGQLQGDIHGHGQDAVNKVNPRRNP